MLPYHLTIFRFREMRRGRQHFAPGAPRTVPPAGAVGWSFSSLPEQREPPRRAVPWGREIRRRPTAAGEARRRQHRSRGDRLRRSRGGAVLPFCGGGRPRRLQRAPPPRRAGWGWQGGLQHAPHPRRAGWRGGPRGQQAPSQPHPTALPAAETGGGAGCRSCPLRRERSARAVASFARGRVWSFCGTELDGVGLISGARCAGRTETVGGGSGGNQCR